MFNFLDNFDIETFQKDLLSWFSRHKRDLPWRRTKDPYHIWVSEIMLQQTRVETVIPYFERFLEEFPTIEALAEAGEEKVLKAWEGLGYYSRARNLQTAVREVKESYGGVVPDTEDEIATLKGVGPYTAGAILSIAYNKPVPAVDGNVMRVLSRILFIEEDIAKAKTRKIFEQAVREMIPPDSASNFNQALMELGAIVCTPTSPACLLCPVQKECRAFHEGMQEQLPVKAKKKPPKPVKIAVAVLENAKGKFLINRRPKEGLLANLWEFPNCEVEAGKDYKEQLQSFFKNECQLNAVLHEEIMDFDHVFSHIKWELSVFRGTFNNNVMENEEIKLVNLQELQRFPFSVSHKKIIRRLVKWNSD
ncbi:A/G-specific adenine glycosylase [Pueribacillus theae]|uniref:Adenine DNA glycosylase n=1 Tax=Pueribacillus theae TaxID=2171751 RepID=A0A2U1JV06_9BACI|nr:A/G-specific adenine glycosylase [Pueribacillus theae]PWA08774.1 A/G-specific adenine glycosylase [Pueribacillus theae]